MKKHDGSRNAVIVVSSVQNDTIGLSQEDELVAEQTAALNVSKADGVCT